ncbi:hypothetical protein B0H16DRAFT_1734206 [Mycena metata]|uniref:Uncharacterized protein n=1 Tax=Mycena metata TaxID=1033252 RepID=A0AAD7HXP4_9AGAR|nr:hypothetical protein B0H16DRAFT_1734206 [Mycena metata]
MPQRLNVFVEPTSLNLGTALNTASGFRPASRSLCLNHALPASADWPLASLVLKSTHAGPRATSVPPWPAVTFSSILAFKQGLNTEMVYGMFPRWLNICLSSDPTLGLTFYLATLHPMFSSNGFNFRHSDVGTMCWNYVSSYVFPFIFVATLTFDAFQSSGVVHQRLLTSPSSSPKPNRCYPLIHASELFIRDCVNIHQVGTTDVQFNNQSTLRPPNLSESNQCGEKNMAYLSHSNRLEFD